MLACKSASRTSLSPLNNEAHVALLTARRPLQLNLLLGEDLRLQPTAYRTVIGCAYRSTINPVLWDGEPPACAGRACRQWRRYTNTHQRQARRPAGPRIDRRCP